MNFPQFGVPLSAALPVATQFTAGGKVTQSVTTANGQVVGLLQGGENGVHYIRPLDVNAFTTSSTTAAAPTITTSTSAAAAASMPSPAATMDEGGDCVTAVEATTQTVITLPITMPGAKPGDPQQHVQIQVVNPAMAAAAAASQSTVTAVTTTTPPPLTAANQPAKYHFSQIPIQAFGQGTTVLTVAYNPNQEGGFQIMDGVQNGLPEGMTVVAALQPQDLHMLQQTGGLTAATILDDKQAHPAQLTTKDGTPIGALTITPVALIKSEIKGDDEDDESAAAAMDGGGDHHHNNNNNNNNNNSSATTGYVHGSTVPDYLQRFPANSSLPLSLQQFLRFNNTQVKREIVVSEDGEMDPLGDEHGHLIMNDGSELTLNEDGTPTGGVGDGSSGAATAADHTVDDIGGDEKTANGKRRKKYKKKPPKPKKPKPGQVHIATALDGTTLFCCPECHMAYPEKEMLEQHLIGHKIERRFICDICGAGLKRKEHLERHKLGHNPERPFVCSICMKGFKRKEHLNLHFVIHSGQKTEICGECGKGFYRKDHLRKHTKSHVTRRAKEEAERQNALAKEAAAAAAATSLSNSSNDDGTGTASGTATAQVTIQVPTSQMSIPVQIQVPQHHIQVDEEDHQISTVVLPAATESLTILPHT